MPRGCRHLTYGERCRTSALRKSGLSDLAISRQLDRDRTTVQDDGLARDPAQQRRPRIPPQAGGGLEPGPDRRPLPQGGRADGGPGVDISARPRRPEDRRAALPVPAPAREEAVPEGWAPFGTGPHPGPRGHLRAPGGGRGEGAIGDREADTIIGKDRSGALACWRTGRRNARFSGGSGGRPRPRSVPHCSKSCCRSSPWSARSPRTTAGSSRGTSWWQRRSAT